MELGDGLVDGMDWRRDQAAVTGIWLQSNGWRGDRGIDGCLGGRRTVYHGEVEGGWARIKRWDGEDDDDAEDEEE